MNTKRQTIWLVSMLSLMVVLSAYYLFTQDIESPDLLTENTKADLNATEAAAGSDQLVVEEVVLSDADREALQKVEEQGLATGGIFSELLAKRENKYSEEENRIMSVIAETQTKQEEPVAAIAELEQLEDKSSKIANLESELMKQYEMALVDEEGDRLKVVVKSEKLEKKQAVDIIKLVMNKMEVNANQISVQYVP
ncbi:Stage III sporulation protein AH [compost metagenome]